MTHSFERDGADRIAFLHHLADLSGEVILRHFRRPIRVENKTGQDAAFDPVTVADRDAEAAIRNAIASTYASDTVIGEEFGRSGEGPWTWVLDPIDGTRGFVAGVTTWGTLIGLLHAGEPQAGMMNQPFTAERYWASPGGGHYRGPDGERPLRASDCRALEDAVLATTAPELFAPGWEADAFAAVSARTRFTRYGTDCHAYCLLAAGSIDLVVEAGLHSYDIAPLIPIVEAAGGVVTCWDAGPASEGGRIVAAATPELHKAARKILSASE